MKRRSFLKILSVSPLALLLPPAGKSKPKSSLDGVLKDFDQMGNRITNTVPGTSFGELDEERLMKLADKRMFDMSNPTHVVDVWQHEMLHLNFINTQPSRQCKIDISSW
jgi:hypothetical protein